MITWKKLEKYKCLPFLETSLCSLFPPHSFVLNTFCCREKIKAFLTLFIWNDSISGNCMSVKLIIYHLVSQSITALCSCRWPAPCPALANVPMMTMSSGKPVPSPLASMSVAMGISVLRRTVQTPSPTWLLSRTIWVVSSCKSCRFSCTISSCSESFGGVAVMRVSQDWRREGSTQASWARDPHRHSRLGFGLFSAGGNRIIKKFNIGLDQGFELATTHQARSVRVSDSWPFLMSSFSDNTAFKCGSIQILNPNITY